MTQVDLATAVGSNYDQTKLSNVENGNIEMKAEILIAVCQALNILANWLLFIAENPQPESIRLKSDFPSLEFVPLYSEGVVAGISGGTVMISREETYVFRQARLTRMKIEPGQAKI